MTSNDPVREVPMQVVIWLALFSAWGPHVEPASCVTASMRASHRTLI